MIELIDSHHHLWDTRRLRYELLEGRPQLNRPYMADDFIAAASSAANSRGLKFVGGVCIEVASAGADGWSETELTLQLAADSDRILRFVSWVPIEDPGLAHHLDRIAQLWDARIVGVRRSFELEPPDFPRRASVVANVQALADYGYSFDLVLFHPSLPAAVELVQQCPHVHFILDHLGKPPIKLGRWEPWATDLRQMARLPNVVCKVSGLVTEAEWETWTGAELAPYVHHAIDCFGWDRVLFGSDWPMCNLAGGYGRWLAAVHEMTSSGTETERRKFFADNARRVYRLDDPKVVR